MNTLITIGGIAGMLAIIFTYLGIDKNIFEWGWIAKSRKADRDWFMLHEMLRKDVERLTQELEEAKRSAGGPNDPDQRPGELPKV